MKVRVSHVFADFINETARERGFKVSAYVQTMSEMAYQMNVGEIWDAYDYNDISSDGELRAIALEYPYEYYCPVRYLSTERLLSEFRRRRVVTVDDLKDMIEDVVAI